MPCLTVQTNVANNQITDDFMKQLSAKVAQVLGKLEQYVAIQVSGDQKIFFGGTNDPAAIMELVAIGLPTNQTNMISKEIMEFFEDKLNIKTDRICLKFTNVAGNMMDMIIRSIRYASSLTKISQKPIDDYTYCINNVRKIDYENFLCTSLLRPSLLQRPAMTIRAFNVELALIRDQISNTQIGRMRLQFWRETIDLIYSNSIKKINHPVAREINLVIKYNQLTKLWFHRLIQSRDITLNDMPFTDIEQLENYLEQSITPTYYLLLELAKQRSLNADHIVSHLGHAQGFINIVRGVPYNAHKRRCFIPLSYLIEHNISQQDIFNGQFSSEQFRHVIYELCNRSYFHLQKSVELFEQDKNFQKKNQIFSSSIDNNRSLFLPIIVIYDYLKRIKLIDFDLTNKFINQRNPWLIWNLWRHKFPSLKDFSSF